MGTNTIRRSQKPLKVKQNMTKRECIPSNKSRCLSCQQTIATTTFYLLTKMSPFQCSVCWKVENPVSHKVDKPQKGYKKS